MKQREFAILATLALGFAMQAAHANDELVIAVAGPMTGPLATLGEQMRHGAETAAAAINDAGGIGGRKIKIVIEDDACDPKQAVTVANRIVGRQIRFVDGHACSGSSLPASDIYTDNNVLMISPATSSPLLTDKKRPTIMRFYGRGDVQGAFVGRWIAENYKGKKVAILNDKSAYGKMLADSVAQAMNNGGLKEKLNEGLNAGEKDYSALVAKLKAAEIDAVFFGGYHTEAGLIVRQAADQGYKLSLISGNGLATREFWAISGPAGEGTLFAFPSDPRRLPTAAKALALFKAQNYEAEGFTLFSFGAVQAIAEGVRRAGSDDPKKVANSLENGKPVATVLGDVVFDVKGDIKDPGYDINRWRAGEYAPIER